MTSTKHQAQSTDKNRDKVNVVDFKDIPDDTLGRQVGEVLGGFTNCETDT